MSEKKDDAVYNVEVLLSKSYERKEFTEVKEKNKDWVLNGDGNSYYDHVNFLFTGSPTNAAVINSMSELIYGDGLRSVGASEHPEDYARMLAILRPSDARKLVMDLKRTGQCAMQIIRAKVGNAITNIYHIPIEKIAPEKRDKNGDIPKYWYCEDWTDTKKNPPKSHPNFDIGDNEGTRPKSEIKVVQLYQAGSNYFSLPDYVAAMPYAEMEIEIANFYVSHIQNGLSFGHVVNFNNGVPDDQTKDELERKVKGKLTGSKNAGRVIVSFNDNQEAATTIDTVESNTNHEQWQYLTEESRQQIITGHRVTSPMLLGIKDNTGLGNNADEIVKSSVIFQKTVVGPFQNLLTDALEDVFSSSDMSLQLYFKPLLTQDDIAEGEKNTEPTTEMSTQLSGADADSNLTAMEDVAEALIAMGEDISEEEYELIDVKQVHGEPSNVLQTNLASTFQSKPQTTSDQDNELFKIRYVYAGNRFPQREFCRKLMLADKVYRMEDIEAAGSKNVNPGFGPRGTDKYSIWLYKGGANCKHFWERRVYLRRNNKRISVNEARRRILELEPEDRADARLPENDRRVARRTYDQPNHGYLTAR